MTEPDVVRIGGWLLAGLVLLLLLVAAFVWKRKKSAADGGAAARGEPLWGELQRAWRPVWRDLSRSERQLATAVVLLGDAVWGRAAWLEQLIGAPAGEDPSAPLRVYRREHLLVLRLSDEVWLGDPKLTDDALASLSRELPQVLLFVHGVDFRDLHGGAAQRLSEWAQATGRLVPLFSRGGRSVGVRVCVTGLESEPGYAGLRELWLAEERSSLSFEVIEDRERLGRLWQGVEGHLGALLGAYPKAFESAVRLVDTLPHRLHSLTSFSRALREPLRSHTRPGWNGVHLTDVDGNALPKSPLALSWQDRLEARAGLRSVAWRTTWALAGVTCGLLFVAFLGHGVWLSSVAESVASYRALAESVAPRIPGTPPAGGDRTSGVRVDLRSSGTTETGSTEPLATSGPPAAPPSAPAASPSAPAPSLSPSLGDPSPLAGSLAEQAQRAGAKVRGLRFWGLPFAATTRRAELARDFVEATRDAFLEPVLTSRQSFARRVFATVLDRANADNAFGDLVLRHPEAWASQLQMPERTVADFVRVQSQLLPSDITPRDLDAVAQSVAQWQALVMELSAGVNAGVFPLELPARARRHPLFRELPESAEELRLLRQAVALIAAELAERFPKETRPARNLEAELAFVERNASDLVTLRSWLEEIPDFTRVPAPTHLAELLDRLAASEPAEGTDAERVLEVRFDAEPIRFSQEAFRAAVQRTSARAAYVAFLRARCGERGASETGLEECPYLRAGYDGGIFFPVSSGGSEGRETERLAVEGPNSGGYGPSVGLPGVYTREAFTTFVQPALTKWEERIETSLLPAEDRRGLVAFVDGHLEAYSERYDRALRTYVTSLRFQPATLGSARSAVAKMAEPGSWFFEFVGTAAQHADLPLQGVDAAPLQGALAPFAGLVRLGGGKGLEDYGKLLLSLLSEIDGKEPEAASASTKRLTEALTVLGAVDTYRVELEKWLDGEQLVGEWRRPFELPFDSLRAHAMEEIRRYWFHEVVRPAAPLLRRYPFNGDAEDVAVSVEALTEEFGPKGRLWTTVEEVLTPLVVPTRSNQEDRRRRWTMRPRVPAPPGLLEYLDAAERLTALLWSEDGKVRKLKVRLTPLELPSGSYGEPLIALAYLSLAGAGMQSFNQVSDETSLQVPWWSREGSSLTVEVLDEHASEVKAFYEVAATSGPWSFFKLLDNGCGAQRGSTPCAELSWAVKKLPGHPMVRFELTEQVVGAFRELARLSLAEGAPVR